MKCPPEHEGKLRSLHAQGLNDREIAVGLGLMSEYLHYRYYMVKRVRRWRLSLGLPCNKNHLKQKAQARSYRRQVYTVVRGWTLKDDTRTGHEWLEE